MSPIPTCRSGLVVRTAGLYRSVIRHLSPLAWPTTRWRKAGT
ncbi:hypothetical protein O3V59_21650 [Brevibacillus thermoruber]|uniref:Uncharacterized protein n=1 Tax=Brevibacillus thermoruber TaxID=33942 RepID=A0A9X3Z5S2_9BACL|nr:hypothetical protein [Brevibacillus thermoruber]MDA5110945.1 hypothetical protein [Brevibacillus thermoruber]